MAATQAMGAGANCSTSEPMSRLSTRRGGQSFVEYALILILLAIVLLSILLILGDDLRTFLNDLLQTWFPATPLP